MYGGKCGGEKTIRHPLKVWGNVWGEVLGGEVPGNGDEGGENHPASSEGAGGAGGRGRLGFRGGSGGRGYPQQLVVGTTIRSGEGGGQERGEGIRRGNEQHKGSSYLRPPAASHYAM